MKCFSIILVLFFIQDISAQSNYSTQDLNYNNTSIRTKEEWQNLIDRTWGEGLPTEEKLAIFDEAWKIIDHKFACFQNIDVDWDYLRVKYRSEIESGVSQGRFSGIFGHMLCKLRESHTIGVNRFIDTQVLRKGLPIMVVGSRYNNTHFGACLTPLPDKSLLVYKAVENHPFGIERGDIILGYDGIPWHQIYPQLIEAELPMNITYTGSSPSSYEHSFLVTAGMNWHLFNTIDIIKYSSGDTVHVSTDFLGDMIEPCSCTDQMEISLTVFENGINRFPVSWGIIEGTNIGYIRCLSWTGHASEGFDEAIRDIMFNYSTDGLIIDYRSNDGGSPFLSSQGYALLFNEYVETLGFAIRNDSTNHYSLETLPTGGVDVFTIFGDSSTFYDKPIAMLVGPACVSAADNSAFRLLFHPNVRTFGKPTAAAFSGPLYQKFGETYYITYARANAFIASDPDSFLTHTEFPIDENIWLTQEDVVNGEDTVVKKAIAWIEGYDNDIVPDGVNIAYLSQNYPNPFNNSTTIEYVLPGPDNLRLEIFNVLGKRVDQIELGLTEPGHHKVTISSPILSSGMYVYRIKGNDFIAAKKMMLIK